MTHFVTLFLSFLLGIQVFLFIIDYYYYEVNRSNLLITVSFILITLITLIVILL